MVLYFLRHGDAVQNPTLNDSDRPLSDLGRHQAQAAGEFLRSSNIHLDGIFSSPLVRAVETADIIGEALGVRERKRTEYLIPGSRKKQLVDLINATGLQSILLAGHEPHLSQTVSLLLSGRDNLPLEFRKCSLACLVASEPVREGHALLQWLVASEQMEFLHH